VIARSDEGILTDVPTASPEVYVRLQATYVGRLGVNVGIFVAVDHLRRADRLSLEEENLFFDVDDCFRAGSDPLSAGRADTPARRARPRPHDGWVQAPPR
jgi:hypothetical protein